MIEASGHDRSHGDALRLCRLHGAFLKRQIVAGGTKAAGGARCGGLRHGGV
jgi:hypothetical protein